MSMQPNRRGLLRGLFAALIGGGAASAAAAPAPPPCPHYYDGVVWCKRRPGQPAYYVRDAGGCPFCAAEKWARMLASSGVADVSRTTTYVYDGSPPRTPDPSRVTTTIYDPQGRLLSVTGLAPSKSYKYKVRET